MQAWSAHSKELLGGAPSPRLRELVDALAPGARVLEVGCGGGRNTRHLSGAGFEVVALDVASVPLLLMGRCCDRVRATADFHLPFASSSFDGVLDSYAFTFVVKRRLYARELRRVLKPSGLLLLEFDAEPHVPDHGSSKPQLEKLSRACSSSSTLGGFATLGGVFTMSRGKRSRRSLLS